MRRLIFNVPEEDLGHVLAHLAKIGITNVNVRAVAEPQPAPEPEPQPTPPLTLPTDSITYPTMGSRPKRAPYKRPDFAGGVRYKGISGEDLVMQIFDTLPDGTVLRYEQLADEFAKHNFNRHSCSSYLTKAVRQGKIIRLSYGAYYKPAPVITP